MKDKLAVGVVRGSHGLSGEFKVISLSGFTDHFLSMDSVDLVFEDKRLSFKVESATPAHSGLVYMKLAGIESPQDVQKYNRWMVEVSREKAHQLSSNEWYVDDLEGCALWYKKEDLPIDECVVGVVKRVFEGGSGFLVEAQLSPECALLNDSLKLDKAGKPRTVYVPFNDMFIGDVDVEKNRMQLLNLWILE